MELIGTNFMKTLQKLRKMGKPSSSNVVIKTSALTREILNKIKNEVNYGKHDR